MIGAETAAITHGHELGYIPAAGLVHIVQSLSHNENISLLDAVLDMKEALRRQFTNRKHLSEQIDLIDKAIIASVNHSGDSDSTGAVNGNILGAYLGLKSIPQKYLDNLELKDVILEIADDLYNDCKISEYGLYHDEIWEQKYIYKTYKRTK